MKFCELSKSQNRVLYMSTLVMLFSPNQRQGYEDLPGGPDAKLIKKNKILFKSRVFYENHKFQTSKCITRVAI